MASQTLLNPFLRLLRVEDYDEGSKGAFVGVDQEFGVDFSMPMLKTNVFVKGKSHIGMVVHRQFLDVCFADRLMLQQFPLSHGFVSRWLYFTLRTLVSNISNFSRESCYHIEKQNGGVGVRSGDYGGCCDDPRRVGWCVVVVEQHFFFRNPRPALVVRQQNVFWHCWIRHRVHIVQELLKTVIGDEALWKTDEWNIV